MSDRLGSGSVVSNALDWWNFLAGMDKQTITIPNKYRQRALKAKEIFDNDVSGLINTVTDFMIKSACQQFKIETSNENLNFALNDWADSLNSEYSTYIPTGLTALAKQYFTERWKGSSHILLRCAWDTVGDLEMPIQMVFVAGEDIIVERPKDKAYTLDNVKYSLRITNKLSKDLPANANETIYVRKPFETWNVDEPMPFVMKRGIWYNVELMRLLLDKTSFIVSKAMKYILHVIQGSEAMETKGIDTYSKEDLQETQKTLKEVEGKANSQAGTPVYATNWDTALKHMIPDYELVVKQSLFTSMTQRIMNGLGIMELERSSRKEDMLNPKPMIAEIENGVKDFIALIEDVLLDVKKRNQSNHPKWFRNTAISIWYSPYAKDFLTKDLMDHIRAAYDRGVLSKETYASIFSVEWQVELDRRTRELDKDIETLMFPHVVQNQPTPEVPTADPTTDEKISDEKKGPEKKNFKSTLDRQRDIAKERKEYEEAPYNKISDLPKSVKVLPAEGQQLWMQVFNENYKDKGEDEARKIAWSVVKQQYEKDKDGNWVKK